MLPGEPGINKINVSNMLQNFAYALWVAEARICSRNVKEGPHPVFPIGV